jgi:hypothetical protein
MMSGNAQSKFVNEYNSEEDVNDYKEEYENVTDPFYHCAHCNYKTYFSIDLKEHMKIEHTEDEHAPLAESESLDENLLMDAIEVWKIYKLLQRMKKCI